MPSCPILTYHSQLLFGNDYGTNSHVGLAEDLGVIAASGRRIVALQALMDGLVSGQSDLDLDTVVCITFDDGCDFDWLDIEHPQLGLQLGFGTILRRHKARYPGQLVHATSFVLADPAARATISQTDLGHAWMNDTWWAEAEASGLLVIESHGLDHRHPGVAQGNEDYGHFHAVADAATCQEQIDHASDLIQARSGRRPRLFAYPYGQASDYLRHDYLPRFEARHGIQAAIATEPAHFHWDSDRWFIPRYVSLQDWHSPEELARLLA